MAVKIDHVKSLNKHLSKHFIRIYFHIYKRRILIPLFLLDSQLKKSIWENLLENIGTLSKFHFWILKKNISDLFKPFIAV